MNSNNDNEYTPENRNYQNSGNYKNNNINSNSYRPTKNIPTRGRADSSISIDNSQINNNRRLKANKNASPAVSVSSVTSTYTSPITRPSHQHNHSRSDSINSRNSNTSSDSKQYLNSKNVLEKKEKVRTSPKIHSSSSNQFQDNKSNNYKSIRVGNSNDSNSYNSNNYRPVQFKNVSSKNSLFENDVTSQISNGRSVSTMNSNHKDGNRNKNNNNNNNNGYNRDCDNNSKTNENNNGIDSNNPKIKVNDNTLKNPRKYANNAIRKNISSKMSINSGRERVSISGNSSSDIGNYYASNHGIGNIKTKSSISYQLDTNGRTLTSTGTNALNSHAPSINIYNPANFLNANNYYSTDIRKKYSSRFSISSNSTILAPPKKYLNHNSSLYAYPKFKQMIYIVLIMFIVFCVTSFANYSTKWIIIDTRLKSNVTNSDNVIIHYEFGIYKYCYNQVKNDNIKGVTDTEYICSHIESTCPKFCTSDIACVNFNPVGDGKDFEDQLVTEDSKDPEYSFCKLTSTSRLISKFFVLLNFINVVIGASILYLLLKYREFKKGDLKEKLKKRLSIISEHYSFGTIEKRKSKIKNGNTNIESNNNNSNNNNNFLNVKEEESVLQGLGHPMKFAEPESFDDSSSSNINININDINSNNNNNNSNNNKNGEGERKNQNNNNNTNSNTNNQTTGHITYNIPTSPTPSNSNINESLSIHLSQQNISSSYINPGNYEESDQKEEELILKRKRMIKYFFTILIIFSLIIGALGFYFIVKWVKEHRHIGMEYKVNSFSESNIELDKSLGVALILITIASCINVIIAIYLVALFLIIHCSKSKIYWNNEADDDLSSQSFDSLHPYNANNYTGSYNPTNYNHTNTINNLNINHIN
jgi:hypothetical protein